MNEPAATTVKVLQTQEDHLDEVGQFLHERLGSRFSKQAWIDSLRQRWAPVSPNLGTHLRSEGRVVGVLCAIYSEQTIAGKTEKVCNPHSWVVDESYRNHSIGLLLTLLRQRGYHFTMFTPNPKVAQVFMGLRFRVMDDSLFFVANLPSLGGAAVATEPAAIRALLEATALQNYEAHAHLPWLHFAAFGSKGDACLVVYKLVRWKRMPCAQVLHISDAGAMQRHGHRLRSHLLLRHGATFTRIEGRLLAQAPRVAIRSVRRMPKLVLSPTLQDNQVTDLYSELVALDL